MPSDYPHSGIDLYRLAKQVPEGVDLLRRLVLEDSVSFPVVLGADTDMGPCFARRPLVSTKAPRHTRGI